MAALALTHCFGGESLVRPEGQLEWILNDLIIYRAHELSTGRGVVVAVLDSGVDATQPDLVGGELAESLVDPRRSAADRMAHMRRELII